MSLPPEELSPVIDGFHDVEMGEDRAFRNAGVLMNGFRVSRSVFFADLVAPILGLISILLPCLAIGEESRARQIAVESNLRFQNEIRGQGDEGMILQQRMAALYVPGVSITRTTAPDYAKFVIELQRECAGKSHLVLNQRLARMMLTAGMGPSQSIPWGLGVRVGGTKSDLFFEHGGSGVFQKESIGYLNGDGIVILTNGGRGGNLVNEIARSVAHVYLWRGLPA